MEIEQKERGRMKKEAKAYGISLMDNGDKELQTFVGQNYFKGEQAEHLHLQKEVIQPLRDKLESYKTGTEIIANNYKERISKLEAENKDLRDGIVEFLTWMKKTQRLSIEAITAIDQLLLKNEG